MTRPHMEVMMKVLAEEQPDVAFAHWPVDTHMDHQVASFPDQAPVIVRIWLR